ncbi:MAG: M1 family metallopeptidase [Clostridiales bacterium]|nr:M1 family metallopeptidase [Clostridiales bacterium]
MRKKITAMALTAALGLSLAACGSADDKELTKYTITAELSGDKTLTASVVVDYVNNTDVPLDEVWFHLYPNAYREGAKYSPVSANRIAEAYPAGRSYSSLDIQSVTVNGNAVDITVAGEDENILSVATGTLDPTDKAQIQIDYTLKLPEVRHRLGYTDKSVNLANFYPIACVYENGAFVADPYYSSGDPFYSECADYEVTLTLPEGYECAATGVVSQKTENTAGESVTVTYEMKAENVRDFAAVCGEYQKMSGLSDEVIVNYYYYNDADAEGALAAAIDSVRVFGELFGDYPYAEYTVVQTGFLQGGMEYPALSMISDECTGDVKKDVIIHETAHQWWYGAVGNNEVKYAWLDEGLAEYSTMMFYENAEGYNYTFNAKRADALSAYMLYCETYKNNGLGDTSMTRAVNEYDGETEYTYMTYVKGALMLDDVRNTVGSTAFLNGLKTYYKDNKFGIAEPQNLVGAMESSSKRQLNALFDSWLNGNVKLYSSH